MSSFAPTTSKVLSSRSNVAPNYDKPGAVFFPGLCCQNLFKSSPEKDVVTISHVINYHCKRKQNRKK